jgi:hypothetical protein
MSNIPYPNKSEQKKNIQMILDDSGLFDEKREARFTEYVPAKLSHGRHIVFPLAAAAAVLLIVSAVKFLPHYSDSTGTPMTNSFKDDTIRTASKTVINDDITVEICTDSWQDTENVQVICSYPKVYYQGKEAEAVTEYYTQKINDIRQKALEEYKEGSQVSDISVLYSVSVNGNSEPNESVITICETYAKTVRSQDGGITVNEVYGSNFDVSDGHKITIEEIFNDEGAAARIGSELAAKAGQENLDLQSVFGTDDTQEIMSQIIQTDSWYMGTDGIVICVNNIKGKEQQYNGESYKNYYSESFIIQ